MKSFSMLCLLFWLLQSSCFLCVVCDARQKFQQRNCGGEIRHVHLAVGKDPSTDMTVSFATHSSASMSMIRGAVVVGTDPMRLNKVFPEEDIASFYHQTQPRKMGNYSSPYYHHVSVTGLQPNTTYYYKCIVRQSLADFDKLQKILDVDMSKRDSEVVADVVEEQMREDTKEVKSGSGQRQRRRRRTQQRVVGMGHRFLAPPAYDSTQCACPDPHKIRSFTTAPAVGTGENVKFAIIGDIGQFPHSEETMQHLRENHNGVQAIMLAGDLAYPGTDQRKWDSFMDFLDDYPLVEEIPMQITPGNHDIEKHEHGKEIFQGYEHRFRMPRAHKANLGLYEGPDGMLNMDRPPYPLPYEFGNAYYAFKYGPAHWIVLSSYSAIETGSKQYEWFVRELERVDRNVTPWLLVMFHTPLYNTFSVHQKDTQILKGREFIEPLLVEYKANLVFNGHIHAYQRTTNVAFGNVTDTGPMHIVMGAGGRAAAAPFLNEEPEDWVVVRDATIYGYGLLVLCNKTHARWDWVHTGTESDHNVVWKHNNVSLPVGGVDHTFVENQYFLHV